MSAHRTLHRARLGRHVMSKLPYEAPRIAVHGDIRDLTLDGGGGHRWRWWHHHHHDPDPTFS